MRIENLVAKIPDALISRPVCLQLIFKSLLTQAYAQVSHSMLVEKLEFNLSAKIKDAKHRISTDLELICSLIDGNLTTTGCSTVISNVESFELFEFQESTNCISVYLFVIIDCKLLVYDSKLSMVREAKIPPSGTIVETAGLVIQYQRFAIHLDHVSCLELINGLQSIFSIIWYLPNQSVEYLVPLQNIENTRLNPLTLATGQYIPDKIQNGYLSLGSPFVTLMRCTNSKETPDFLANECTTFRPRMVESIVDFRSIINAAFLILERTTYVAVLDSLGRIAFVDGLNMLILNIWKGMRGSQFNLMMKEGRVILAVLRPTGSLELFDALSAVRIAKIQFEKGAFLINRNAQVIGNSKLNLNSIVIIGTCESNILKVRC